MKKYTIILLVIFSSCGVVHNIPEKECCRTTYYQTQYYPKYNWFHWNKPQNNYVIIKPNNSHNKPNNRPNNRPSRGHRK